MLSGQRVWRLQGGVHDKLGLVFVVATVRAEKQLELESVLPWV